MGVDLIGKIKSIKMTILSQYDTCIYTYYIYVLSKDYFDVSILYIQYFWNIDAVSYFI